MELKNMKCKACEGLEERLSTKEITKYFKFIKNWKIKSKHIEKDFNFKDFKSALDFVNKVGSLAEEEGHHPDIYLSWGKVKITLFTHNLNGLSINDFVIAAKIDTIY